MFISVSCFCCFWRICGPQCTPSFKRIRILESGKFLLVGSRIPRLWNREYSSRIRYPTNDWNPESKCHWQRLESSTCNPESKTALDSQGRYRCYPYQDSTKSFFFKSKCITALTEMTDIGFSLFGFSLGWVNPPRFPLYSGSVCYNGSWPMGMSDDLTCWRNSVCSGSWSVLVRHSGLSSVPYLWSGFWNWCLFCSHNNIQSHLVVV